MPDRFNYVKRGYDPQEVDNYIESLENVVKSYKEKDSAIKNALVNAQLAADNIIKNAELEVGNTKVQALEQLSKISYSIQRQRTLVDTLRRDYSRIVDEYIKQVDERDFQPIYDQITKLEEYLESLKQNSDSKEPAPAAAPAVSAAAAPPTPTPSLPVTQNLFSQSFQSAPPQQPLPQQQTDNSNVSSFRYQPQF